jgi:hypothetical protein
VKDALTKSLGASNAANVAKATLAALMSLHPKVTPPILLSFPGADPGKNPLQLN